MPVQQKELPDMCASYVLLYNMKELRAHGRSMASSHPMCHHYHIRPALPNGGFTTFYIYVGRRLAVLLCFELSSSFVVEGLRVWLQVLSGMGYFV